MLLNWWVVRKWQKVRRKVEILIGQGREGQKLRKG